MRNLYRLALRPYPCKNKSTLHSENTMKHTSFIMLNPKKHILYSHIKAPINHIKLVMYSLFIFLK